MCTHSGVLVTCQWEAGKVALRAWGSEGLLGLLHTSARATVIL